jgi:hypothetical protein
MAEGLDSPSFNCSGGLTEITVLIDDAGSGDLLFGVVIGAYHSESQEFKYDVIDVQYFQPPKFGKKEYLKQASKLVFILLGKLHLEPDEPIRICRSYLFDEAVEMLIQLYGADRIRRVKVTGEPQRLTELAYLDEVRNLGYEPLANREEKRAKSFFDMLRWLKKNPEKVKYAKTGWPRLSRYRMFREIAGTVRNRK